MKQKSISKKEWIAFLSIVILIIITWTGSGYILKSWFGKWQNIGQFGDTFGYVNSLFTGLAFAGTIFAILLQRKELILQREELQLSREELKLTREEMKGQKEQLALQVQVAEITKFENTLFRLLGNYESFIQQIKCTRGHMISEPKEFFSYHAIKIYADEMKSVGFPEEFFKYVKLFQLFNIALEWIEENAPETFKNKYMTIAFANLSYFEKQIFKYFLESQFSPDFKNNLRKLISQYKLNLNF